MSATTGIPWTDHTFNIAWGCQRVSPGCQHCYAEAFAKRLGLAIWGPGKTTPRRTFGAKHWAEPLRWNRAAERAGVRRRVFCSSMADVFEDHPTIHAERERLWALIRETPSLDWQLLTKRPERLAMSLPWGPYGDPWPNVWLGTSIEHADYLSRARILSTIPARIRFLSLEPLLGPLPGLRALLGNIHWVIAGGESGPKRRPMELVWLADIAQACVDRRVAFFCKQDSAAKPDQQGRIPDALWARREFPLT